MAYAWIPALGSSEAEGSMGYTVNSSVGYRVRHSGGLEEEGRDSGRKEGREKHGLCIDFLLATFSILSL